MEAPGASDGQGSLVCYSPRGCKESDMTEQLKCTELIYVCIHSAEVDSVIHIYIYIYNILFSIFFRYDLYEKILNIVPCAIQ